MKKVVWTSGLIALAISCAAAAAAGAQSVPPPSRRAHGKVRLEQRIQKRFGRLDQNKDGVIAKGEWTRNPRVFDRFDANHDGVLSRDEFQHLAHRRMRRLARR
jgi:hypothetical protein